MNSAKTSTVTTIANQMIYFTDLLPIRSDSNANLRRCLIPKKFIANDNALVSNNER